MNTINVYYRKYDLFTINIGYGSTSNFGHEICQVDKNVKRYLTIENEGHAINTISYFDTAHCLFLKK